MKPTDLQICLDWPDAHHTGDPTIDEPEGNGSVFHIEGCILAGADNNQDRDLKGRWKDHWTSTPLSHHWLNKPGADTTKCRNTPK